jgi:methionine-rich copper-binding protein CopC
MKTLVLLLFSCLLVPTIQPAAHSAWRQATDAELAALLPARAPVEKEHIETELRTATGITDGKGHFIAAVLIITAGYSADGKYSHYMIVQAPMRIAGLNLAPGTYALGWERDAKDDDALNVHIYDAQSGKSVGTAQAHLIPHNSRVETMRIWPPGDKSIIQIGRFGISYEVAAKGQ